MTTLALEAEADSVGAIEKELSALIRRSTGASDSATVVRARTLNLIVRSESPQQRERAGQVLASLARTQPSRAIVVSTEDGGGHSRIEAHIATRCQSMGDKLLCYEQVSIDAHGTAGRHVAGVVEPLLVSHLPVCLWWLGDPAFSHDTFRQLAEISDRIILDSQGFADLEGDLAELLDLCSHGPHIIIDLNWQRLLPWREVIAQLFGGGEALRHLGHLSSVSVKCTGGRMQGLLLAGWLASRLGWRIRADGIEVPGVGSRVGRSVHVSVEAGPEAPGELVRVAIASTVTGGSGRFEIERQGQQVVTTMCGADLPELSRTGRMGRPSEAELLQNGLALRYHDTGFEEALQATALLAPLLS